MNQQQGDGAAPAEQGAINRINIKIPPFWHDCPEIWFAQVEAQFAVGDVRSDRQRFNTVVGSIESQVLRQVSEAVLTPPEQNKYENLKRLIIERFAESAQTKIQKLLSALTLGDQKPSQLLAEMRRLGGTTVSDELMRTLWLKTLPQHIRAILATSDGDLSQQAALADKVMEVSQGACVQNVAQQSTFVPHGESALEKQIAQLTRAVELLTHHSRSNETSSPSANHRNRSHSRSRFSQASRSRQASPTNAPSAVCWYHSKFGNKATRCVDPCVFAETKN